MRAAFLLLLLLGGCDQLFKITHVEPVDAGIDAPIDAQSRCVGQGILKPCINPFVDDALMLAGTLDTDSDPRCVVIAQTNDLDLCALVAVNVDVGSVVATGSRPLVLVAFDSINITGTVDLTSRTANSGRTGAGAQAKCTAGGGTDGTTGAGGGGGGSYGFTGGFGAAGQAGGAAGGLPGSALQPQAVHGGCPGQSGGIAGAVTRATGGAGGGAFYAIAVNAINVTSAASINVSGAGGHGGAVKSGGAGGGAGGMVGLDAAAIVIAGHVFSRGGGGGGGGGFSTVGGAGADAPNFSGAVAGGIAGATGGTSGGDGGDGTVGGIPGGTATNGGGAGGGSCGWIFLWGATTITGSIKPAAITP